MSDGFEIHLGDPFPNASVDAIERACCYRGGAEPGNTCCHWGLADTRTCCGKRLAQLHPGDRVWMEMAEHRVFRVEGDTPGAMHHQALWEPHRCT